MNNQFEISFPTNSPINKIRLSGQNLRLYNWLMEGNVIHCMSEDMNRLGIGYLNSRISDIKKAGIVIEKRFIKIGVPGDSVTVKLYWIPESYRLNNKIAA